jgi:hypothetical protein
VRLIDPALGRQVVLNRYLDVHISALSYRGEACQHLDLEVKRHFHIGKVQPEV